MATALQMLQGRVPGVSVTGAEPNTRVQIWGVNSLSGTSEPLFLLDGVLVTADALAYFPAADVETIEILKGGQAALLGSRGSGGVIAVYTRRGSPNYRPSVEKTPGVLALRVPGYVCAREFYAPRYDVATARRNLPDPRRSTLYWNSLVRTNAAGQADVTFFTADATGPFRLAAEGVSAAGRGHRQFARSLARRARHHPGFAVVLLEHREHYPSLSLFAQYLWLPPHLLSPWPRPPSRTASAPAKSSKPIPR